MYTFEGDSHLLNPHHSRVKQILEDEAWDREQAEKLKEMQRKLYWNSRQEGLQQANNKDLKDRNAGTA